MNKEPPPPMVLVPPLFDFPPLAARTRMLESSYNLLFGKLSLKCLFEDYFEEARHFSTRIMLKPIDDPHVDLIATVSGPLDLKPEEKIIGNALFRWQSDVDDPHTFMDLFVSNSDPILRVRSSAYYPKYAFGAFGIFPVLSNKRISSEDYGVMGLRYGSTNLSIGATLMPFALADEFPKSAWLVSKIGRLTAGVQYEPQFGSKDGSRYKNLMNWSCAIGYGLGSGSPLSPSFNFGLELAKSSQFIASFYQHIVVQRRVKNPLEENEIVGITNYIDFGFELQTRNRTDGKTGFGFDIRVENIREASYQRADPNFVMLTPSKEHLAEGILWKIGKRPMLQSDENTPSVVYITNLAVRQDAFTLDVLEVPQGSGSGFVWDKDGHIVTNYHVIRGASDLRVTLADQSTYDAKVVGFDQDKDVAVLRVEAPKEKLRPIPVGISADLLVGQKVYAIGNPFGFYLGISYVFYSGLRREISSAATGRPIQDVIQTDAAINPGNSGGPLLDSTGSLIGINTAIYSPSGASSGVGFSIPVDTVGGIVDQLVRFGKVTRPILGIKFAPDQSVEQLGVSGVLVLDAPANGPAGKAGLQPTKRDAYGRLILGDIITSVNEKKVMVEVLRGDHKEKIPVILEPKPDES
ncbi:hypothetical protein L1049_003033 [Liquidambar formosana]|uniref:PDZ domain-containing protein n=1 Tax=Liquidambar formosana TaxID=63359 RepID=A0AAP0NG27_LIQFO